MKTKTSHYLDDGESYWREMNRLYYESEDKLTSRAMQMSRISTRLIELNEWFLLVEDMETCDAAAQYLQRELSRAITGATLFHVNMLINL